MSECGAIGALIVGGKVVGSIHCDLPKGHDEELRFVEGWAVEPVTDHAMTLRWKPEEDPDLDLFDANEQFDLDVELVVPPLPPELCGMGGCVFLPHADDAPHSWEDKISDRS